MIDPIAIFLLAVLFLLILFAIWQNCILLLRKSKTSAIQRLTARLIIITCCLIFLLVGQLAVYEFNGQHEQTRLLCSAVLIKLGVLKW